MIVAFFVVGVGADASDARPPVIVPSISDDQLIFFRVFMGKLLYLFCGIAPPRIRDTQIA